MDLIDDIFALPPEAAWQEDAACAGADPQAFLDGHREAEARAVCRRCPVQQRCLEYALEHDERFGVWGGLSPRERDRLRSRRRSAVSTVYSPESDPAQSARRVRDCP